MIQDNLEDKAAEAKGLERSQVCRMCLSRGVHLKCLHTDKELSMQGFLDFFTVLTTVQVNMDDELSNHICQSCIDRVLLAYDVRKLAQQSDVELRATLTYNNAKKLAHQPNEMEKKNVCGICAKIFPYRSELERHKQTHAPRFKCITCNKVFGFKSSLRRHEQQHLRKGSVECPQCLSLFKDEKLLKRHTQYAHQDARHKCDACPARLGSASALRAHTRRHTAREDRSLRCRHSGCERAFNFQHQRRRHEATHTGEKYHFCSECGAGFIQAHHLTAHMPTHRPELQIPCTVSGCLKTFSTRYALNKHLEGHNKKLLVCVTCGKQLPTARTLRSHTQLCHASATNAMTIKDTILCNTCGKLCARTYLKKHQLKCPQKLTTPLIESNNNHALRRLSTEKQIYSIPKVANFKNKSEVARDSNIAMDDRLAVSKNNRSLIANVPKKGVDIMQSSQESACTRQELVRDIVDMMEDNLQNTLHNKVQLCHEIQDVTPNIEDAIKRLNCNGCCQNTNAKEKPLETLRSSYEAGWKTKVDGKGCCKDTAHLNEKETNSKETSREDNARLTEENIMQRSDCKEFLGNCIVSAAGADCICAKVSYDQEAPLPEYLSTPLLEALEQQGYYPS